MMCHSKQWRTAEYFGCIVKARTLHHSSWWWLDEPQ